MTMRVLSVRVCHGQDFGKLKVASSGRFPLQLPSEVVCFFNRARSAAPAEGGNVAVLLGPQQLREAV